MYARKVEYLYTLVYKTLEALTDKKKGEEKKGEEGLDDEELGFDVEVRREGGKEGGGGGQEK